MIEKFVFSNEKWYRIARHFAYWIFFIFFILHYSFNDFTVENFKKILAYMPYDIASTYFLLLVIVPRVLKRGKFMQLLLYFLLLVCVDYILNEFIEFLRTGKMVNYSDNYWNELKYGIEFSVVLYAIPLTIKVIKYYYTDAIKMHQLEKLNKENEIKVLTDQLNPHFLFNALATIRALIGENNNDAKQVVNEMSEYFRYSLVNNKEDSRTLEDELSLVRNYIEIQKIRFKSNIQVEYSIEEKAKKVIIPLLAVQNLVENAIKYGSKNKEECLEIEIRSFYKDNQLRIKVINSGTIQERKSGNISTKTGLDNLQKRLDILYPNTNSFNLYEKESYVYAVITLTQTKTTDESLEHSSSG